VPDSFSDADLKKIESSAQQLGRDFFARLDAEQPHVFQRRWWDDRIMSWAMDDETVKVQMFRFVDVLPMLHRSDAVAEHLSEYLAPVANKLPAAIRIGMAIAKPGSIAGRALSIAARRNARGQARRFIAGTTTGEVIAAARRERKLGRAFTLDILGEAVISEVEAERFYQAYVDLIEAVAPTVNAWPELPQIDRGVSGRLPRVNVSVKLSALDSQFDPVDPLGTAERVGRRLRELLRIARQNDAFINVDMESYKTKDLALRIFKQVLCEEEFRDVTDVGIVIQAYLRDAEHDLIELRDWAAERGTPVWVRLVKGAYWDYETIHARSEGWPIPVFQRKPESDVSFERLARLLMQSHEVLRPALGSHNIRSLAYALATAEHLGLPQNGYEVQMLYGMGDAEKTVLVDMGYRMRIYMPYGELIPGMAYLVRRLLENTSNDSFLRASFTEHVAPEKLLMNPLDALRENNGNGESASSNAGDEDFAHTFQNEPLLDFAVQQNRKAMQEAITQVGEQLGGSYSLVIGDQHVTTDQQLESHDPSRHDQLIGTTAMASAEHAQQAVSAAVAASPAWADLDVIERAELLRSAANIMRRRRHELAALIIYESGKDWRGADADVCEAIDFCDYYADGAIAMHRPHGVNLAGEENRFEFAPRGVTAVIAPWNFPLAILTGMTAAALATGNTVVMKPAEQTPVVAAKLMEIFVEAGFPPGVVNYLPGDGEVVGAALVDHPEVAVIAFTGSRPVGLAINARAAAVSVQSSRGVKKVIAEMGGKNAIIVDEDADLDEAVAGVMDSAFGFQGQKCSACSRAIVLAPVYDAFLKRLVEATRSLQIGPAIDPASRIGPLIDRDAVEKVSRYVELGRQEGRELLAMDVGELAKQGCYVGPHIFADVDPMAKLAQEEVFGPVLAVIRATDLDEAIRIANGTEYALTAGIFSRSPINLERAQRELAAGNIYLDRAITGALVGRQPFGGYRLSGIGSKAGGPDYLLQFVVPRTITENTMRRGFAPGVTTNS